jgi:hypothetical protein
MSPTAVGITLHADGEKIIAGIVPAYKRMSAVDGYNKAGGDERCWKALAFGRMSVSGPAVH